MSSDIENRLRDQKKKIFAEEIAKNKPEQKTGPGNPLAKLFSPTVEAKSG